MEEKDEFLLQLIDTLRLGIKKYGKAGLKKIVQQVCYKPSSLPRERFSSLQHLRGEAG